MWIWAATTLWLHSAVDVDSALATRGQGWLSTGLKHTQELLPRVALRE